VKQNLSAAKFSAVFLYTCFCFLVTACATLPKTPPPFEQAPAAHNHSLININTATAGELEVLPGIGSTMAERIIDHRARYGSFRRAEHLMMVRGISDKKFRELQPLITVD
jgi:competence ComEA-like helix-hairpin-helix protein